MNFRLLRTRVGLVCPPAEAGPYRRLLARFETPPSPCDLTLTISSRDGRHAVELSGDEPILSAEFPTAALALSCAYTQLIEEVVRRNPDHLCLHAAALAREGRALVLAAESGHGKTTLGLALSRRGFSILSDEVAPIRFAPAVVEPFPLAIGCRPGTPALLRAAGLELPPLPAGSESGEKIPIDAFEKDARPARPAAVATVVVLEAAEPAPPARRRYRAWIEPAPHEVLAPMRALEAVASARLEGNLLFLETTLGPWPGRSVEAILAEHGVIVFGVEDLNAEPVEHGGEPVLTELSTAEGVLALLRHLRGFGRLDALARETAGGFPSLVAGLVARFSGVAFHRLTPGKLPPTLELLEAL